MSRPCTFFLQRNDDKHSTSTSLSLRADGFTLYKCTVPSLSEHVRFLESRTTSSKLQSLTRNLQSARARLLSFTGAHGLYSVLRTPSSSHGPTTSPIAAASKTSDVALNAPTAGEAVAPIVTSTSGRVLRRPVLYKDSRR